MREHVKETRDFIRSINISDELLNKSQSQFILNNEKNLSKDDQVITGESMLNKSTGTWEISDLNIHSPQSFVKHTGNLGECVSFIRSATISDRLNKTQYDENEKNRELIRDQNKSLKEASSEASDLDVHSHQSFDERCNMEEKQIDNFIRSVNISGDVLNASQSSYVRDEKNLSKNHQKFINQNEHHSSSKFSEGNKFEKYFIEEKFSGAKNFTTLLPKVRIFLFIKYFILLGCSQCSLSIN